MHFRDGFLYVKHVHDGLASPWSNFWIGQLGPHHLVGKPSPWNNLRVGKPCMYISIYVYPPQQRWIPASITKMARSVKKKPAAATKKPAAARRKPAAGLRKPAADRRHRYRPRYKSMGLQEWTNKFYPNEKDNNQDMDLEKDKDNEEEMDLEKEKDKEEDMDDGAINLSQATTMELPGHRETDEMIPHQTKDEPTRPAAKAGFFLCLPRHMLTPKPL